MRILVIGGTQFFGKEIVRLLLERRDRLTVYSRGRRKPEWLEDVEHLVGDRTDHAAFVQTFTGRSFDVVIDNIAYTRGDVDAAIDAFSGRAGRYVLTSSVSVYPLRRLDPAKLLLPIYEDSADLAFREGESYSDGKRACEQALLERAGRDLPFTIIRPPVVQGPEDPTGRAWFYVQRIADGGPILVPSSVPTPATRHVFSTDLARAYVAAIASPAAADRTYNVAMEEIVTLVDYVRLLAMAMDRHADIVEVPKDQLSRDETLAGYRPPFGGRWVADISRVQRELSWTSTPVADWLRVTAAWLLERAGKDSDGYAGRDAERKAAARWREGTSAN